MEYNNKTNLYPCAHCNQTGTCSSGKNGQSCMVCVSNNEIKGKEHIGLLCGSCSGLGLAEPKTERINKRIRPVMALALIFFLLGLIVVFGIFKNPHFPEVLTFSATLLGSIVTYYYSAGRG